MTLATDSPFYVLTEDGTPTMTDKATFTRWQEDAPEDRQTPLGRILRRDRCDDTAVWSVFTNMPSGTPDAMQQGYEFVTVTSQGGRTVRKHFETAGECLAFHDQQAKRIDVASA